MLGFFLLANFRLFFDLRLLTSGFCVRTVVAWTLGRGPRIVVLSLKLAKPLMLRATGNLPSEVFLSAQ